jgi:hypothetical protein
MALRAATSAALAAATFTQLVPPRAGDAPLAARLLPFVVAVVADASQLSGVVAAVCRLLPLPTGLGHLKRVRRSCDGAPAVPPPPAGSMLVLLGPGTQPGALRAAAPRADEALAALAATPGFAGYAAVAAPSAPALDRAVFATESRCVWPMGWVQPAAAQLAAAAAAPLTQGERAYFAAALGVAAQAARDAGGDDGNGAVVRACVITLPPGRVRPDGVRTAGKTVVEAAAADDDGSSSGGGAATTAFRGGLVAGAPLVPALAAAVAGAVAGDVGGGDGDGDDDGPLSVPIAPHEFIVRAVTTEVVVAAGGADAASAPPPSGTCVFEALRRIAHADKQAGTVGGGGSGGAAAPAAADGVGTSAGLADELDRVPSVAVAAGGAGSASRKRSRPDDASPVAAPPLTASSVPAAPTPGSQPLLPPQPLPTPVYRAAVAGGYVCTGHDAFLSHEPDPREAMALLHARVARVVFLAPDPHHGALGGAGPMRLHELRSLNHHYLAYRAMASPLGAAASTGGDGRGGAPLPAAAAPASASTSAAACTSLAPGSVT